MDKIKPTEEELETMRPDERLFWAISNISRQDILDDVKDEEYCVLIKSYTMGMIDQFRRIFEQ